MTAILVYILNTPIKDMILINDCDIIRADKLNEIETVEFPNSTCISTCQWCKLRKIVHKDYNSCYCENPICRLKNTRSTIFPFINIPFLQERIWTECEIGYFDIIKKTKDYRPIKIDHIIINSIKVLRISQQHHSYGYRYGRDDLELSYSYEISVEIYNHENEQHINHIFTSNDLIRKEPWGEYDKSKALTMKYLFQKTIPLLIEYVKYQKPINLVNFNYIEKTLPQRNNYTSNVHRFNKSDALNIIYSMEIKNINGNKIIRFGARMGEYINFYIANLINSILNINLKYDIQTKTIYSELPYISQQRTYGSLKEYVSCLLYLGIIKNYNDNLAKQEYLIAVPIEGLSLTSKINFVEKLIPSKELIQIFSFFSSMDATHFQDGITRVGRDDKEWKELSFTFPLLSDFRPNMALIQKINELLQIKLTFYQSKNDSNSIGYSYFEIYDDDYIGGLACNRTDLGSTELRKTSFHKLVCAIMDYYLHKPEEFTKFTSNN